MATLTITANGQVTLRRELLHHLGVQPGEQIEVSTLPGGRIEVPALWEIVWVLRRVYAFPVAEISATIRALMEAGNVNLDRAAVEAGLWQLEAGGDFADAVIAHQGQWLGSDTFLSFDRRAVALLQQRGIAAELLA
jgi:predicted nucleic-acid-binding protein